MKISDGMTYAPKGKPCPVVKPPTWITGISMAWWGRLSRRGAP